jgi:hypothetical protein
MLGSAAAAGPMLFNNPVQSAHHRSPGLVNAGPGLLLVSGRAILLFQPASARAWI